MSNKIFKKGDAYEPQNGDWCVWRGKRYDRRSPDNWEDYGWLILDDAKVLDLFNYVPDFEIRREVPDEPYVRETFVCCLADKPEQPPFIVTAEVDSRFKQGDRVKVTIEKVSE